MRLDPPLLHRNVRRIGTEHLRYDSRVPQAANLLALLKMNDDMNTTEGDSEELPPRDVALSESVTQRIVSEMGAMRESTEAAALSIGELLTRIVQTATRGNEDVKNSLAEAVGRSSTEEPDADASITEVILRQMEIVTGFIDQTREFFQQHLELAASASEACQTIQSSAREVSELTKTSQVLAINLRIEAARMGDKGNGFTALGQEVQGFSRAVGDAAEQIQDSVAVFLDAMPRMHQQTLEIESKMQDMSVRFDEEMATVNERTTTLTESLKGTLDQVESRNNEILNCSNQTLSHLGFQDPVAQGLERLQHDVQQMHLMVCGEKPDFRSLADIREDVGHDGSAHRDAGEVELF